MSRPCATPDERTYVRHGRWKFDDVVDDGARRRPGSAGNARPVGRSGCVCACRFIVQHRNLRRYPVRNAHHVIGRRPRLDILGTGCNRRRPGRRRRFGQDIAELARRQRFRIDDRQQHQPAGQQCLDGERRRGRPRISPAQRPARLNQTIFEHSGAPCIH